MATRTLQAQPATVNGVGVVATFKGRGAGKHLAQTTADPVEGEGQLVYNDEDVDKQDFFASLGMVNEDLKAPVARTMRDVAHVEGGALAAPVSVSAPSPARRPGDAHFQRSVDGGGDACTRSTGTRPVHDVDLSGDIVYALFLEPPAEPDPSMPLADRLISAAVEVFQPSPVMAHCELLIPPTTATTNAAADTSPLHFSFATYIGQSAAWQTDERSALNFYLIENATRWRAVPVFATDAVSKVRDECMKQAGTPYSIMRYLTSALPLRAFAGFLSDERMAPAHCATLTTRVLKKALDRSDAPTHSSAYYGPATLYDELCSRAAWSGSNHGANKSVTLDDETAVAVDALLRGTMSPETVAEVGDGTAGRAVRALSMKVCSTLIGGDEVSQVLAQRQLATALLRWTVLRNHGQ